MIRSHWTGVPPREFMDTARALAVEVRILSRFWATIDVLRVRGRGTWRR